jgi:hypothetical protein
VALLGQHAGAGDPLHERVLAAADADGLAGINATLAAAGPAARAPVAAGPAAAPPGRSAGPMTDVRDLSDLDLLILASAGPGALPTRRWPSCASARCAVSRRTRRGSGSPRGMKRGGCATAAAAAFTSPPWR